MSPFVGDRFVPTLGQEIEEPAIPYELFDCKANALANKNDRDKISENQRHHKNGINMKMLPWWKQVADEEREELRRLKRLKQQAAQEVRAQRKKIRQERREVRRSLMK